MFVVLFSWLSDDDDSSGAVISGKIVLTSGEDC